MNEEQDLKQLYRQQANHNPKAPAFDQMWAHAQAQALQSSQENKTAQRRAPFLKRTAIPALLTLAFAALVSIAAPWKTEDIPGLTTNHDALADFVLELEDAQALALLEWEAPTDFLLQADDSWFYEP